jgi:hypothetical protein
MDMIINHSLGELNKGMTAMRYSHRTIMHSKIKFRLADATLHEFYVVSDLLRAFGAILTAYNWFVAHARYRLAPCSRQWRRFHKIDDGIHPRAAIHHVLDDG